MLKTTKLSLLAACTLFLGACSSDDPAAEPPNTDPESGLSTLDWTTCPNNDALDCATLSVPMDYSDDQTGDIEIALNRLPALQQPAQGVLMVNGGGPGPSLDVTETIAELEALPDSVRERYDTISFDPRGFGLSTPVVCEVADEMTQAPNLYLANEELIDAFVLQHTEAAQQCHAEVGDYLLQLGSMNVVRDMESIREALGVEKLSFISLSYGTRLAALYLQNYSDRSDAFILDASEKPDTSNRNLGRDLLPVFQQNLESLLMLCSITDPNCDAAALQQLLIDRTNLLVSEGELEELSVLLDLVTQATGDDPEFGELLIAPLAGYLLSGETEDLLMLHQMLLADDQEEDEEGTDSTIAGRAVFCADDSARPSTIDLQDYLQDFNTVSDFFAEFFLEEAAMCAGWPESSDPLPVIATSTAPKSLIIGGLFDTTSPIVWSEEMANAIGGFFLASGHEGHTIVYGGDSDCVDDIATEFLIDGILPSAGDCL